MKADTIPLRERETVHSLLGYQRLYLRMTREQLSARSGISVRTIRDYETGKRNMGSMSTTTAISLCHALGMTFDAIAFA
jgi:transcriptional regulator with XRE-family HTH domain